MEPEDLGGGTSWRDELEREGGELAQSSEPTSRSAVALRPLPLAAAGCRRLPLAAGRPPQMEDEDYVVASAAGAAGTRGARPSAATR